MSSPQFSRFSSRGEAPLLRRTTISSPTTAGYQTAWLIRIQAARARAERRGQRQAHQRDTFNPERLECNGGWDHQYLRELMKEEENETKRKMAVT
jgi:hypothetical protein